MKTLIKAIKSLSFLTLLILCFSACEDVIEVDLETSQPRLVVNAPLQWQKGTTGSYQFIELATTAGYYEETPPPVSNATVTIRDNQGNIYYFKEGGTPGRYECFNFVPGLNRAYELEIKYNRETFIAEEILYPVASFEKTEQVSFKGVVEETEVRAFFTDPADEINFYLVEDKNDNQKIPGYYPFSDQFFNGNTYFSSHFNEDLEPMDQVNFKIFGVSSQHHDYLLKFINSYMGGPFQTVPGLLRGNLKNITNPENYALGYFSLSQVDTITHTVE